jgi:bacterioferritin-associated ferredoxin
MTDLGTNLIDSINKKTALFLIAGTFLGLTVGFLAAQTPQISEQQASQKLVSTLEAQSGQQLEVVNTETENGVYKIDISDSEDQLSTYHVTKDGRMVSAGMSDLDQLRQTVAAQQQFAGCLANKSAVLYGNSSQQATAAQIQVLGGANMVSPIYQDVGTEGVLQEATQRGIERVPTLYYNESALPGPNSISQISEFTGCQFGTPQ